MKILKSFLYSGVLLSGLIVYSMFRKTPTLAYQSMIHLFCITRGRSNEFLSLLIGFVKPMYEFNGSAGDLIQVQPKKVSSAILDLRSKGYHIFENKLSEEMCSRLLSYGLSNPCESRAMDGDDSGIVKKGLYSRAAPETVRYDFSINDLLANEDIQNLLSDMSLCALAQQYLGSRPVIDVLSMWWHTAYSNMPDKEAAQFYHFDMDRPKWLKFFIYLTDVNSDSGAHSFVEGSHKVDGIPAFMLNKGYARLTDDEVESFYGRDKLHEFSAPRGTIIAEDTRGLHKGKHVKKGDRLILQIQFSNCLFGGSYPKTQFPEHRTIKLQNAISRYPGLYSAYL